MLQKMSCDSKQGDRFYSAGQHGNLHQPELRQSKNKKRLKKKKKKKKNEADWSGQFEIKTRNKLLAVGEACVAIF